MDVLGIGIVAHPSRSVGLCIQKLAPNSVESKANRGDLGFREDACGAQGKRVRLTGNYLLFEKLPVKLQRALPMVEERIEGLPKAPRPHLHLTTSFLFFCSSRARVRAGRPSIWIKPFASFWS